MKHIKTFCAAVALTSALIFSGCQQRQTTAAPPQSQPTAAAVNPPCEQSPAPDPWIYNHHSDWDLPGTTVPEIHAAAKKVLIDDWKMPSQIDSRIEYQFVDFLSASIKVSSALNTTFDLTILKLNEKVCRLAIDAKSKQVSPAQLEEHCSLMYNNIITCLNALPRDKQNNKVIWDSNQKMYIVEDYKFDHPVKHVFDAAIALLEQMHVSRSSSGYDDFAGQLWFKTGNNCEMAIYLQMTDEGKCLLTFFSRNKQDNIIEKWGEIFIQRLRQKLTEPQTVTPSPSIPDSKPAENIYYGQNRSPSSVSKIAEFPYSVETVDTALKTTLQALNINVPSPSPRDALTAKFNFKTANSADWWVTISQISPNQSKVLFSATSIYAEDFKKYTAVILENLEKQLQQPEKPAAQPAAVKTEDK